MTQKKPDMSWVHRQAGMAIQFECQDKGKPAEVDYTTLLGQVQGKNIWIVLCELTVTDSVANGEYWWPEEAYLAVSLREDGMPTSRHATDGEIALFEGDQEE